MLLFVIGVIAVGSLLIIRQSRHTRGLRVDGPAGVKEERSNGGGG